tara:strand:- start:327 stop:656 length:330 start_codon:yes stop_codon:yes gene_type:complete
MSEYKADYNYDSDIEYIVKLYRSTDILCAGPFKTLNDLFNDLYDNNDNLIFDTEDKKDKVCISLKQTFRYKIDNLEILQVDISCSDEEIICTCPRGFKGVGPYCKKCKD